MVSFAMTLSDPHQGFKVTVVLKGEYLQTMHFTDTVTIGRFVANRKTGKLSNGVTFDTLA